MNEIDKNKNESTNMTKCEKWIDIIQKITVILGSLYAIISYVYNFSYQKDCQVFYQIPGKYFREDIGENLIFIGLLTVLIFFVVAPMIIREYNIKKGSETKEPLACIVFLEVMLGMIVGTVNVNNLLLIMVKIKNEAVNSFIDAHAMLIIVNIIALFIIVLLCITLRREINHIKSRVVKNGIIVIFGISWVITISLMILGIMSKWGMGAEDITKYEFAEKDNQHYIVVSDYKDKKVAMKYDVVGEICYIDTEQYYLIDDQAVFSYINLKHPPKRKNID